MNVTNAELRFRARKQLGGNIFATMWLMTMVVCIIAGAILGAAAYIPFAVLIIYGPLEYGLSRVLSKTARGSDRVNVGDLFAAFRENFGRALVLGLLEILFVFLWSLLFIIPGIVKSYAYSMCFYIQQDSENKNWSYCLKESQRRMKGYKMKLFLLDLSFIGWYILGMLCFYVGILFVEPYHQQARANFYETYIKDQDAGDAASAE